MHHIFRWMVIVVTLFLSSNMVIFFNTSEPKAKEDVVHIQLLGMNDFHGKIDQQYKVDVNGDGETETVGRIDVLASYLKKRQNTNKNTLLIHAGDMIGVSSPVSAILQDEPTAEMMNTIGFDVGTVGNHEFDQGINEMLRMIKGGEHPKGKGTPHFSGMNFPVIAANIKYKDTHQHVLKPYHIEEIAGEKIGFIGVVTTETPKLTIQASHKNIYFTDETDAVNKYTKALKDKDVRAIVVLSHVPATQNRQSASGAAADMAESVDDEVDIIMAAHNHQKVNAVVDDKLIVQAYEYGKAFADIDIAIDPKSGDIVEKNADIVHTDHHRIKPDQEIAKILKKYQSQVAPKLNETYGEAAFDMTGGFADKGEVGDNALGNLLADAMRNETGSDFAFMNGGGIRHDLHAGSITWKEVYKIQPFGNWLVTVEVTGANVRDILNAQISLENGPNYSVSGLRYTWNAEKAEVVELLLQDGTPIESDKTYTLTVNNFMATSDSGTNNLIGELGENAVDGPLSLDATINFIKSFNKPIAYEAEGRISEGA